MRIHVVSLDRTPDRLLGFIAANGHLTDLVRFRAVDGQALNLPEMVRKGEVAAGVLPHYTAGAIGNVMSHVALWSHAIETNRPLTVCEDDAILNRGFVARAEALLAGLPPEWDWVSWGWNFDAFFQMDFLPGASFCTMLPDQRSLRINTDVFQKAEINPSLYPLRQAFGVACYSISPRGALAFKSACWPIREMKLRLALGGDVPNGGIDVMTSSVFPRTHSYVCFPPLAATPNDVGRSTVQGPGGEAPTPDR